MAFFLNDVELICPRCRQELEETQREAQLTCVACTSAYPVVVGIPDLRISADPYISVAGDHIKGEMLSQRAAHLDLAGLIALYFDVTPEVPAADVRMNTSRLLGGVSRAEAALQALEHTLGPSAQALFASRRWLDVGCGSAPMVAALAQRGVPVVGVDVAFRWLVIGKKRLAELGVRAPLVAACAEALPFREASHDVVTFQSSLEVVRDQEVALGEAFRVTRGGGRLVVTTPNRLSLGPDPHIGVFAGGYLPRGVVDAIAKLQLVRPPHRRLMTASRLRRALIKAGWRDVSIDVPGLSPSQREQFRGISRRLAGLYERGRSIPVVRQALVYVGPLLQATAIRP